MSFVLVSFWCLCMATNNVSVQSNGGLLPDNILLTQCYYHGGTRLNAMKRFFCLSLQAMIPPNLNVFTFFLLTGGCSKGLDAFRFFFKNSTQRVANSSIRTLLPFFGGARYLLASTSQYNSGSILPKFRRQVYGDHCCSESFVTRPFCRQINWDQLSDIFVTCRNVFINPPKCN